MTLFKGIKKNIKIFLMKAIGEKDTTIIYSNN